MSTPHDTPTVLVLCGGLSPERDVSIRSGRRVAEALRSQGLAVTVADADASLLQRLSDARPDCVLPALHGTGGEDGSLSDVLTTVGIPFVGSPADSARLAFDKSVAKGVVRYWQLPTPDSVALPHSMFRELGATQLLDRLVDRLGLPLMVKPTRGGSALGAAIVHDSAELPAAMVGAFAYGDVALIERYITGTELAVSVIDTAEGPVALPAVEIVPDSGFYDYNARYTAGATEFFSPARLDPATAARAEEIAVTVHRNMALRDYSRIDLIVGPDGEPTFLEANVSPGITETSLLPQAVEAASRDLGAVFAQLVHRAIDRG